MFHQSGGCCDGSVPMCYPHGEFLTGDSDVHLGTLDIGLERPVPGVDVRSQFEYWRHTHLTIDVVKGRGAGFSLEAPYGVRFLTRSRLLTDEEYAATTPAEGRALQPSGVRDDEQQVQGPRAVDSLDPVELDVAGR